MEQRMEFILAWKKGELGTGIRGGRIARSRTW
jgi:hypothetical protein